MQGDWGIGDKVLRATVEVVCHKEHAPKQAHPFVCEVPGQQAD